MADTKVLSSVATSMALLDQMMELSELTCLAMDMNIAQRVEKLQQTKAFFEGGLEQPTEEPEEEQEKAPKPKTTRRKPASK